MEFKIVLTLCFVFLLGTLFVEAQRDGRRRSGRRKLTTEKPPPVEENESVKNPQNLDVEPEGITKSFNTQETEAQAKVEASSTDKGPTNRNRSGKPFIVPRGTRKPRPHIRNSGESRPRPTLPTFARKRGPKPERRDFKQTDENSLVSSTTTTPKPSRSSSRSRNRSSNNDKVSDRTPSPERAPAAAEIPTETTPRKRFGGRARRPSRGNSRHTATSQTS